LDETSLKPFLVGGWYFFHVMAGCRLLLDLFFDDKHLEPPIIEKSWNNAFCVMTTVGHAEQRWALDKSGPQVKNEA